MTSSSVVLLRDSFEGKRRRGSGRVVLEKDGDRVLMECGSVCAGGWELAGAIDELVCRPLIEILRGE